MKDANMFWNLVIVKVSTGSLSETLGPDVFKLVFGFQNSYIVMITNISSGTGENDL